VSAYKPKPGEEFNVELPWISDGYFETLGVRLIAGRVFNASDTATSQQVSVVNESFVKRYFPNPQTALGQQVSRPASSARAAIDTVIVGAGPSALSITFALGRHRNRQPGASAPPSLTSIPTSSRTASYLRSSCRSGRITASRAVQRVPHSLQVDARRDGPQVAFSH
jgi:hypothetical protein